MRRRSPDMRVLFSSTRGTGHLHPLLPYAQALLRQGHDVLVAAPHDVSGALDAAKLRHAPFDHPGTVVLGSIHAKLRGLAPADALALAVREIFAGAIARMAIPKLRDTIASWRPDLVVRESAELGALVAAEREGVPCARVAVHANAFEEESFWPTAIPAIDLLRQEIGLPADAGAGLRAERIFAAFPASLDPNAGPQEVFRVRTETAPRGDLASSRFAFGDATLPFLYITFGTLVGTNVDARGVYRLALDVLADLPVRALLTTGSGIDRAELGVLPANVVVETFVPQNEILPLAHALVCHGGSGTLLGGLAAGLPMVVTPMFADQPHNARRVEAMGAGLAVMKAEAGPLRTAIERVVVDGEMRRVAEAVAREIAALPGVEEAAGAMVGLAR